MKIVFLGGGNMAAALIGGLQRRPGAGDTLLVVERDAARRAELAAKMGVPTCEHVDAGADDAQLVIVAVKPNDVAAVCAALRRRAAPGRPGPLILSIAAGIPSAAIARWCASEAVVRAMPNTPALIGQGITGLFARAGVSAAQRSAAEGTLAVIGEVAWLDDEGMLDAVTAISGSGPAYVFYFIEALQAAAVEMGFAPEAARRFAVQTFVGAAQLADQSPEPLATLRERVTSKGGTTAAALSYLQDAQVAAAIRAAAFAALERSREIAHTLGRDDPPQ